MLFFIYAVIGMQVFLARAAADSETAAAPELDFRVAGFWEDRHGGRDANQPQQQLPDLPAGCPHALPVSFFWIFFFHFSSFEVS